MPRLWLRVLLAVSLILLFVDLGGSTIWDANEAFYVETPRQMVQSGDYVNPSFNGQPRWNKPVLSYWVVAGFYQVFGVSVATERLAIAVGAVLLVLAAGVIGRTIAGADAGVVAALALASAPRVMLWSRRIFIDVWFTALLALALMAFVLARARPERRTRWFLAMYAFLGLAMLTKGPVALVLPGFALAVWLTWTRRWAELGAFQVPAGLAIIVAIVAPWYVADYLQNGPAHLQAFFIGENVGRFSETVGVQSRGPLFYVPVLLTDLLPWSLFLPAAALTAWRAARDDRRLLLVWIAAFVGIFSLSSTKQDLYIFPIAPAVAALVGALVAAPSLDAAATRVARWGAGLTGLLLASAGGLFVWIAVVVRTLPELEWLWLAGAVLALGGLVVAASAARASLGRLAAGLGTTAVACNIVLVAGVMRPLEAYKPVAPMSEWLTAHAGGAVVAHYKTPLPSMTFYLDRPVTPVFDLDAMTALVGREPAVYVLTRPGDYAELERAIPGPWCVIERRPLPPFDAKLSQVLSGDLPEIWLAGAKGACASR